MHNSSVCQTWSKEEKVENINQLCHTLYCNNVICNNQTNINQKIALLRCTISQLKKIKKQLVQKRRNDKLKECYQKSLLTNKVINIFDVWYTILKFSTVNNLIGITRISKLWHQHTIKILSLFRLQLVGENSQSNIHSWFSDILHPGEKKVVLPILFGLENTYKLKLQNLNISKGQFELPMNLNRWIEECKTFALRPKNYNLWHPEWVKIYLHYNSFDQINVSGENGSKLIHWACQKGYLELVKVLLQNKYIDTFQNGADNRSTLAFAIESQNISLIHLIVTHNPNLINKQTCGNWKNTLCYPIHLSLNSGSTEILNLLLEKKANPFLLNERNENAFDLSQFNYRNNPSVLQKFYKLLINGFSELAKEWNMQFSMDLKRINEKEKLCFILDSEHFYFIPASCFREKLME